MASALLLLVVGIVFATGRGLPLQPDRVAVEFERLGPFGGEVRSLLIDFAETRVVYLGTSDGRIFKSTDGAQSWNPLVPGIGQRQYVIDTLVQDPSDHRHIFAGGWDLRSSGGGLFETRDSGATWTPAPLPESSPAVRDLAICRSQPAYMIVGTLSGAYVSKDGGRHWQAAGAGSGDLRNAESVAIDPSDPRYLYVGTWRLSYRSSDFGNTWVRADRGMIFDSDVFSLCVDGRDPQTVFASACSGIYRSSNRASDWTRLKVLPDRMVVRTQVVYVDPTDSLRVFGGTTEGLFVSRDGGRTWRRTTGPRVVVNAIQVDPTNSRRILLGTGAEGVLLSEDNGLSWRETNSGFVRRQITRVAQDPQVPDRVYAGIASDGSVGGFYSFDASGGGWTPITPEAPSLGQPLALLSLPGKSGRLLGTSGGLYFHPSGKETWTKLSGLIARRSVYDLSLDPSGRWILAATDAGIYRSSTGPLQFQMAASRGLSPRVNCLAVSSAVPGVIYAGTSAGVLSSSDSGETWQVASVSGIPSGTDVESLAISPGEKGHIFAGTSAGLFESLDGGSTWERSHDGRLGVEVPSIIFLDLSGRKVLAADGAFGGIFFSGDGGRAWEKLAAAGYLSPVRTLVQDRARPEFVYAGTRSDGVYRLCLQGGTVSPLLRIGQEQPRLVSR